MDHNELICPPQYESGVCFFCLSVYVYTYCVVTGSILVLHAHLPLRIYQTADMFRFHMLNVCMS